MKIIDYLELALTAWFAYRLVRSPRDRGLRVIVIALLAMLLGEGFVIAALRALSAELLTPGPGERRSFFPVAGQYSRPQSGHPVPAF